MDKILAIALFVVAVGLLTVGFPIAPIAVIFAAVCTGIVIVVINNTFQGEEKLFVTRVFFIGLIFRAILAGVTYGFNLQDFFGGDSTTYDIAGYARYNAWFNFENLSGTYYEVFTSRAAASGWGMPYLVAAIYTFTGRNTFAVQLFNSVLGAATACLIYNCAKSIFSSTRVARIAAVLVAGFPSLILWSSQGLKDGIICFLLGLAVNAVFALQKKFNYVNVSILLFSLFSIYALRFYIFFAFAVAILGSFFIGAQKSVASIARQVIILIVLSLGLTYLGILDSARKNLDTFGNLEQLNRSRLDQATTAESAFGKDIDVSTSEGALGALPLGLTYIMLAPFPWQVANFRQAITLPEVFFWWSLIPFMLMGIFYSVKNRFRESISILLFTLLLTVSYSLFQGNVGTAYRMRAQMQIFYFIFVAAGIVIWLEKQENKKIVGQALKNKRWRNQMAARQER